MKDIIKKQVRLIFAPLQNHYGNEGKWKPQKGQIVRYEYLGEVKYGIIKELIGGSVRDVVLESQPHNGTYDYRQLTPVEPYLISTDNKLPKRKDCLVFNYFSKTVEKFYSSEAVEAEMFHLVIATPEEIGWINGVGVSSIEGNLVPVELVHLEGILSNGGNCEIEMTKGLVLVSEDADGINAGFGIFPKKIQGKVLIHI